MIQPSPGGNDCDTHFLDKETEASGGGYFVFLALSSPFSKLATSSGRRPHLSWQGGRGVGVTRGAATVYKSSLQTGTSGNWHGQCFRKGVSMPRGQEDLGA